MYSSTKTFTPDLGFSAAFRQWRAESHCRLIHGYALGIRVEFCAEALDVRNWVVDFGSLRSFKGLLENTFDHKLLVAVDDPELNTFLELQNKKLADVVIVDAVGCEAFAKLIYDYAALWLLDYGYGDRVMVKSVEVKEHGANSAIYTNPTLFKS